MLADAAGHGIAAALYTMHLSSLWRRHSGLLTRPAEFVGATEARVAPKVTDAYHRRAYAKTSRQTPMIGHIRGTGGEMGEFIFFLRKEYHGPSAPHVAAPPEVVRPAGPRPGEGEMVWIAGGEFLMGALSSTSLHPSRPIVVRASQYAAWPDAYPNHGQRHLRTSRVRRTYQKRGADETYCEYDASNQLTLRHELTGDAWAHFAYDSRGNCLQMHEPDGTAYFAYNHANLVTSIKFKDGRPDCGVGTSFRHCGQGVWGKGGFPRVQRVEPVLDGSTVKFVKRKSTVTSD